MKDNKKIWWIMLLGIILIIPISYIILKPYINTDNYENRELAKWPTLETTSWYRFPQAIDDFIIDNFPYKNQLVFVNSFANTKMFGDDPSQNTMMGDDGWIFYKGETGQSLMQYKGTLKYTDDELKKIADNLSVSKQYLEDRNCRFILYVIPNKERMYKEYMPDKFKVVDDKCNTEQLIEYLSDNSEIEVLFAYDNLLDYKNNYPDNPVYYHLDTHWNNLGAYIGAKTLSEKIGVELPDLQFERTNSSTYDLANYSGLRLLLEGKDIDFEPLEYIDDYEIEKDEIDGSFIYHNHGKNDLRLMVCRDSFTIAMRRYLGNAFNEVYMPHRNEFQVSMVDDFSPDVFVYEVCERELSKLLNFCLE